jgi:putative redox protein
MGESMSASAVLLDGMTFRGSAGSGHELLMDSSPETGGANHGFRPVELLIVGLAGCTGMDVISILRKMRQDVTAYEVKVAGERQDAHPRIFTSIVVTHVVTGRGLNPDNVARAVELSATRYCPASATISKATPIEHKYEIVEAV